MFKNKTPRVYLESHFYFITTKTCKNKPIFNNKRNCKIFLATLKFLQDRGDFELTIGVLLPDHFHLLIKPIKKNISEILHDLKSYSTAKVSEQILLSRGVEAYNRRGVEASALCNEIKTSNKIKRQGFHKNQRQGFHKNQRQGFHALPRSSNERKTISIKIWQRSFYYHIIIDEQDFENHFNYIYYNAVKHEYVAKPEAWPYLVTDEKYNIK